MKMCGAIGSFVGPLLIGAIADKRHSYNLSILIMAALLIVASVMHMLFPEPGECPHTHLCIILRVGDCCCRCSACCCSVSRLTFAADADAHSCHGLFYSCKAGLRMRCSKDPASTAFCCCCE